MKDKPYQKTVLPNGTRLILVPMEGVNSVATAVMVAVGSRYETTKINGISHFLEHMVFKGTEKYPTTDDVNVIERIGGLQNAYTDIDVTSYHNKVLSTDWPLALEINKELAIKPLLEQKHVDRERSVILEEMKRYEDEPASKVSEVFHHMMYPSTSLGMRIIGEEKSLKRVASIELREYRESWYSPDRIVVVLAGRIAGQEKKIKEKVLHWFASLNGGSAEEAQRVVDHQNEPRVEAVTKREAQQAHLMLGLRTFRRESDDRFAWQVFNLLMGVSFTSRLFREIREKKGLCYHIRSGQDSWQDVGYWSIYAGVATEKVHETVRAIIHELTKVVEKGVTNDEVMVSKKRIETIMAFQSENPEFMGEYYAKQELYHQPILTTDEYLKKIEAVTKDDVNRLVKKYFVTKNLNLALVWNKPEDEKLFPLLQLP